MHLLDDRALQTVISHGVSGFGNKAYAVFSQQLGTNQQWNKLTMTQAVQI